MAGGKLYTKNPKVEPSIIKDKIISKPPILFKIKAIIDIVKKYIALIPLASPSNPSIKLIAFVIPIIKTIEIILLTIELKYNLYPNNDIS